MIAAFFLAFTYYLFTVKWEKKFRYFLETHAPKVPLLPRLITCLFCISFWVGVVLSFFCEWYSFVMVPVLSVMMYRIMSKW